MFEHDSRNFGIYSHQKTGWLILISTPLPSITLAVDAVVCLCPQ